jgi:hypothetical protein
VIRETADRRRRDRGARREYPLSGKEGVFRCLVTASPATRIARLVSEAKLSEVEARKAIEESDRQRRNTSAASTTCVRSCQRTDDVVVNTDTLTVPVAMELLIAAARSI